jgi:hypothetical protein
MNKVIVKVKLCVSYYAVVSCSTSVFLFCTGGASSLTATPSGEAELLSQDYIIGSEG